MKLSIITINLNNAEGLRKTIESVINQTFTDFEYIVIDGASTDKSVDILKQYANKITYWISEPDTGIYNAMNKGLQLAKGEYVHFLNSGDFLPDNNVYEKLDEMSEMTADVIYGNRIHIYSEEKQVLSKGLAKSDLSFDDAYRGLIPHSSTLTKRNLFDKYGLFNESFKIVSDTEFFLKAIGLGKCSIEYVDLTISCFDMNGISKNAQTSALCQLEFEKMKKEVLSQELVEAYEFTQKYGYKMKRINKRKWSAFLFRILNRLAYIIN